MKIIENDTPWIGGFYPSSFVLHHEWVRMGKPSGIINNSLKYVSVDTELRRQKRLLWNQPIVWPLAWMAACILFIIWCAVVRLYKKDRALLERL